MNSGHVYTHANKITHLCHGLPVAAMSTGSGGIGNESVETLLKDLRQRFAGLVPAFADWRLDPESYTVEQVATPAITKHEGFRWVQRTEPHHSIVGQRPLCSVPQHRRLPNQSSMLLVKPCCSTNGGPAPSMTGWILIPSLFACGVLPAFCFAASQAAARSNDTR